MVATHYTHANHWHRVPAFLPSMCVYLARFEKALQRIDRSVVLPYWDWSQGSQAPERSVCLRRSPVAPPERFRLAPTFEPCG
ncbi:hypothetical protein GCM10017752_67650 [Streptomyces roseoviridis]